MYPRHVDNQAHGQPVRWAPVDAMPAGIRVLEYGKPDGFIGWEDLEQELLEKLLPQAFVDPRGWHLALKDFNGKPNWLVQIVDESGERFCDVWFGVAPPDWESDGLVHLGSDDEEPYVWQTFERYSDGSYRRMKSLVPSLNDKIGKWEARRHP